MSRGTQLGHNMYKTKEEKSIGDSATGVAGTTPQPTGNELQFLSTLLQGNNPENANAFELDLFGDDLAIATGTTGNEWGNDLSDEDKKPEKKEKLEKKASAPNKQRLSSAIKKV